MHVYVSVCVPQYHCFLLWWMVLKLQLKRVQILLLWVIWWFYSIILLRRLKQPYGFLKTVSKSKSIGGDYWIGDSISRQLHDMEPQAGGTLSCTMNVAMVYIEKLNVFLHEKLKWVPNLKLEKYLWNKCDWHQSNRMLLGTQFLARVYYPLLSEKNIMIWNQRPELDLKSTI